MSQHFKLFTCNLTPFGNLFSWGVGKIYYQESNFKQFLTRKSVQSRKTYSSLVIKPKNLRWTYKYRAIYYFNFVFSFQ